MMVSVLKARRLPLRLHRCLRRGTQRAQATWRVGSSSRPLTLTHVQHHGADGVRLDRPMCVGRLLQLEVRAVEVGQRSAGGPARDVFDGGTLRLLGHRVNHDEPDVDV